MINLDSLDEIKKLDEGDVLASVQKLGDQFWQAWNEMKQVDIPEDYSKAKNVVVAGMGGSALGGSIVDSFAHGRIRVPVEIFNEYHLPNYVNKNTLVIASSYSGNTEEAVANIHEAHSLGAKVFAICAGGKLASFAKEKNIPMYLIDPVQNPSGQPRLALGYSLGSILSVLAGKEYIHLSDTEAVEIVETIKAQTVEYDVYNEEKQNPAKTFARKLVNTLPVLVASEHLVGAAHAFKNQLNETAKTFAVLFSIPELNHHLLEGLAHPKKAKEILKFVFITSDLYTQRVQKRHEITKGVVEKNGVSTLTYAMRSKTKLNQAFELLTFGSFVQFYLAMLYEINPAPVPWVDYFKKELAK